MSSLYFPLSESGTKSYPSSTTNLHGVLCGSLCSSSQNDHTTWYENLFENINLNKNEIIDLAALFDQTTKELNGLNFDFQLELPRDNSPLSSRISAVSEWCQGFIFGLTSKGLNVSAELSVDCQEYIEDVIKISQISYKSMEDNNSNETNFEEIVENLRIGIFLLYDELAVYRVKNSESR